MPGSTGMLRSSSTTASRPPADEPTPTMGKTELTYSFSALVGEVATKLVFFGALEGLVDFFRVAIDRQDSMPMRAKRPPSCLIRAEMPFEEHRIVVIGASAGGVEALIELVPRLRHDFP